MLTNTQADGIMLFGGDAHKWQQQLDKNYSLRHLVANWTNDPCWDLEDTDGFEVYREELKAHRLMQEAIWQTEYQAKLEAKAIEIGAPGNLTAAEYVLELERRIEKLENR